MTLGKRATQRPSDLDWRRAYAELNEFQAEFVRHGMVVTKFWSAIDKDEQMRRF